MDVKQVRPVTSQNRAVVRSQDKTEYFSLKDVGVTDEETTVTDVKLFGKNHWFLWIQDDGSVSGTREQGKKNYSRSLSK